MAHPPHITPVALQDGRFTLVLGGGGLRGLAHVGVFEALEAAHLRPARVVGTSIGALVGAAWCRGMPVAEMRAVALGIRQRDVFVFDHASMALRQLRARALYRREPLERLLARLVGDCTFRDLVRPLVVNTVELESAAQVAWGWPGLDHVRVADAVFASCALPGTLPPRRIEDRHYADGAVLENLPVRLAALTSPDPILAVDLGGLDPAPAEIERLGFVGIYARGFEVVMRTITDRILDHWAGPPLAVVHPDVAHISSFSFRHTPTLLTEGRAAMQAWLAAPARAA